MTTATLPVDLYAWAMPKREQLGVQEAREKLRDRIDEAMVNGVHTVISRHNKAVATLVPMDWYRRASDALGEPTEF